jgi:hypothetical protein
MGSITIRIVHGTAMLVCLAAAIVVGAQPTPARFQTSPELQQVQASRHHQCGQAEQAKRVGRRREGQFDDITDRHIITLYEIFTYVGAKRKSGPARIRTATAVSSAARSGKVRRWPDLHQRRPRRRHRAQENYEAFSGTTLWNVDPLRGAGPSSTKF